MTFKEDRMNKHFGPAISNLLEESSVRHIWRLSFLVNFFLDPLYTATSKRYNLTRPEVQILYSLKQRDVLFAQDIALITGRPKNTISRAVSLLLDKGYIDRKADRGDKRAKSLELTESGRKIISEVVPHIVHRQDLMREVLTEDEQKDFDELLSKIMFALPEWISKDLP